MNSTVAWLVNFAVANGYAMVFIAAFGLFGSVMMIFRGENGIHKLQVIRQREGLAEPRPSDRLRHDLLWARRVAAVILTVVLAIALAAGIRGMSSSSTVRNYIYEHGEVARGVIRENGDAVTFVALNGRRYTLTNDFFSPSVYPQDDWTSFSDDDVVAVRYLPDHPQAYVIDAGSFEDP